MQHSIQLTFTPPLMASHWASKVTKASGALQVPASMGQEHGTPGGKIEQTYSGQVVRAEHKSTVLLLFIIRIRKKSLFQNYKDMYSVGLLTKYQKCRSNKELRSYRWCVWLLCGPAVHHWHQLQPLRQSNMNISKIPD